MVDIHQCAYELRSGSQTFSLCLVTLKLPWKSCNSLRQPSPTSPQHHGWTLTFNDFAANGPLFQSYWTTAPLTPLFLPRWFVQVNFPCQSWTSVTSLQKAPQCWTPFTIPSSHHFQVITFQSSVVYLHQLDFHFRTFVIGSKGVRFVMGRVT